MINAILSSRAKSKALTPLSNETVAQHIFFSHAQNNTNQVLLNVIMKTSMHTDSRCLHQ